MGNGDHILKTQRKMNVLSTKGFWIKCAQFICKLICCSLPLLQVQQVTPRNGKETLNLLLPLCGTQNCPLAERQVQGCIALSWIWVQDVCNGSLSDNTSIDSKKGFSEWRETKGVKIYILILCMALMLWRRQPKPSVQSTGSMKVFWRRG